MVVGRGCTLLLPFQIKGRFMNDRIVSFELHNYPAQQAARGQKLHGCKLNISLFYSYIFSQIGTLQSI